MPVLSLTEYADHDAVGLAELVRGGEISAVEVVDTALAAIAALNPQLNAVINVMEDEARAQVAALAPGAPFGGVPILLKDLGLSYAGVATNSGSRLLRDWIRGYDSEILKRWKGAGLVALGKTNTPEMGQAATTEPVTEGPTHNPWKRGYTPGGSSGGSAAAVAAGMVPVAHASDGGGSIRGPASCCGLVGIKPTRGRNPRGPDAGETLNGLVVDHVVSRSIRDSAALLDVSAGPDTGDPYVAPPPARAFIEEANAPPGRLRIGFSTGAPPGHPVDAECVRGLEATARLLEELGHDVVEAAPSHDLELLGEIYMTLIAAHSAADIDAGAAMLGRTPSADNLEQVHLYLLERGRRMPATELLGAVNGINGIVREFAGFFGRHDIWLTPTMVTLPPKLGYLDVNMAEIEVYFERVWTFNTAGPIYNVSGNPAISLPLHWSANGLPVGMMLGARFGDEATLFRVAAQLEAAKPWRDHPPVSVWNLA
jgi:amidase